MGIRAVQAGALTDALDRTLPEMHPEMLDYRRAASFRALAREIGESPAALAYRYSLSIPGVATVNPRSKESFRVARVRRGRRPQAARS